MQELDREISRVEAENISLKQENLRWKIEASELYSHDRRKEECLATLVLAFVEIESLRKRLQ